MHSGLHGLSYYWGKCHCLHYYIHSFFENNSVCSKDPNLRFAINFRFSYSICNVVVRDVYLQHLMRWWKDQNYCSVFLIRFLTCY